MCLEPERILLHLLSVKGNVLFKASFEKDKIILYQSANEYLLKILFNSLMRKPAKVLHQVKEFRKHTFIVMLSECLQIEVKMTSFIVKREVN